MIKKIQISENLLDTLRKRKLSEKESYEHVIWDLIEDGMELSEETKKELIESRKQIKEGKMKSLEQIKKEINL